MAETKKHISVSQIGTVKLCPKRWRYRYIEKRISPPGIALVVGSSFDEAYNLNYGQKIASKTDLPVEQVQQKFSDEMDKRGVELPAEDKKQVGEVKDIMIPAIEVFHNQIAPGVQPIETQKELKVALDDEFDLLGFADVVTNDSIIDNKTAGRYEKGKYQTQLEAYIYAYHKITGEVKKAELNYLIKTKKPTTQREELCEIDPTMFIYNEKSTIKFIKQLYKDPDLAFKNKEGWHCDPRWCGYYNECQGCKHES